MKLIIISQTNEGETLTEKEVFLDKYFDRRKGIERYEVPDNFSLGEFIDEATIEELTREKEYVVK